MIASFWSWFAGIFAKEFFNFIAEMINTARNNQAQRDLGASQQKQRDTEAAAKAKTVANSDALAPSDVDQTIKELEDGTF